MRRVARLFALIALASAATAGAGEFTDVTGSRVHLTASASQTVPNDRFIAILAAERRGPNPAELAAQVNAAMMRALKIAKSFPAVQAASGTYDAADYERGVRTGWHVAQELRLESAEVVPLSALIGKLQGEMQVKSMAFAVSPGKRAQAEDGLIARALTAFHDRAALVARALQADTWRIVRIDVQTPPSAPPQVYYAARETGVAAADVRPALAPGQSTVVVTVDGEIRLQPAAGAR